MIAPHERLKTIPVSSLWVLHLWVQVGCRVNSKLDSPTHGGCTFNLASVRTQTVVPGNKVAVALPPCHNLAVVLLLYLRACPISSQPR